VKLVDVLLALALLSPETAEAQEEPYGTTADAVPLCEGTGLCAAEGQCTPRGEACIAADDHDCGQSAVCSNEGRCHAVGGRCIAASDDDCIGPCDDHGACRAHGGRCVAPDFVAPAAERLGPFAQGCLEVCRVEGRCRLDDDGEACVAASAEDCRASESCALHGACRLDDDACVVPTRRNSAPVLAIGITHIGLGVLGLALGLILLEPCVGYGGHGGCGSPSPENEVVGTGLLVTAPLSGLTGIILSIVGGVKVPLATMPELSLGPGTAQVTWRF
jgi:hypothetical protein